MTPEASRRHYLDAMGIASWACRFKLPHAAPTTACEWETPAPAAEPRQTLHALLDEPAPVRSPPAPTTTPAESDPGARTPAKSARALLGDMTPPGPAPEPAPPATPTEPASARSEPVVFTFTCCCINGRWLSVHPGALEPLGQRLLGNVLTAAGALDDGVAPTFMTFEWPPMAGVFATQDPMGEAREGVAAFIEGAARRQSWSLERVLWWADAPSANAPDNEGESDVVTLNEVFDVRQARSHTLELALWQGPDIRSLISASAKRALWPALLELTRPESEA